MSRCKSCGAEIRWAKHWRGNAIPLDPDPHPDGNIVFDIDGKVTVLALDTLFDERPNEPRYRSHFVTCPDAKEWRK